jgi:hypothetical protein
VFNLNQRWKYLRTLLSITSSSPFDHILRLVLLILPLTCVVEMSFLCYVQMGMHQHGWYVVSFSISWWFLKQTLYVQDTEERVVVA